MAEPRPQPSRRRAQPIDHAVRKLWRESGTQFDRALVPLFALELGRDDARPLPDLPPPALLATG